MKRLEIQDKVVNSVRKLDDWLGKNGWAGYDPYDIKGHPIWLGLSRLGSRANFIQKVERRLLFSLESRFPMACRKLLRIRKQVNAKAMGLFASAYINLYCTEKENGYLQKAKECIDWLLKNSSRGYSGFCWGYPFDWQSRVFIPKRTPSGVVSSVCGRAFWDFYQLTQEKRYLGICENICQFCLNDLNIGKVDDDKICFSYTPLDRFHVHNANLFVAEALIRVGNQINNQEFIEIGMKAVNYTLAEQNANGSFYYWGPQDEMLYNVDHYHTGFVLRALYSIYKTVASNPCGCSEASDLFVKIKRCYRHYLTNFFEDDTIPKLKPDSKYPINIHSCAEAILCLSTLSEDFSEGLEILKKTTMWTIDNMQDKKGYFYYMIYPNRTIKIPYIRWAQAWMLNALSMYLHSNYLKGNS